MHLDPEYKIIYGNKAYWKLINIPKEDITGRPCYETVGEYVGDPAKTGKEKICSFCRIAEALESKNQVEIERPFQDRILKVTTVPELDDSGEVCWFTEVIEDITKRRRAEEELIKAHDELERRVDERTFELGIANEDLEHEIAERTRMEEENVRTALMLDIAPNAVTVHDFEGRFLYANQRTFDLHGYSRDEFMSLTLLEIDAPVTAELIASRMQELREHGEATFQVEHTRKDGSILPMEVYARVTSWGDTRAVLSIATDITERKKAEGHLKHALLEKETLLRELYHRTKNNMQVITSLLGLQARGIDDKKTLQILEDTKNRIHSMALVHEKLYKAKNLSKVFLGDYVKDLAEALMKSHNSKIALCVDVDKIPVSIDTITPLGLVINELMTNALKYAFLDRTKGEIIIKASLDESENIELTFSDNGIGMPEDINLDRTGSLGLTIVRTLVVTQIKGKLEMKTQNGTSFTIRFKDKGLPKRI
jgi:PAS domain S-box-containing protein